MKLKVQLNRLMKKKATALLLQTTVRIYSCISLLEDFKPLDEGQEVEFEVLKGNRGPEALVHTGKRKCLVL